MARKDRVDVVTRSRVAHVAVRSCTWIACALLAGGWAEGAHGGPAAASEIGPDSVRVTATRLDLGPAQWQETLYGIGATRAAAGDVAGAAAVLEQCDLTMVQFTHADRAAFLLAECYAQLGAWSKLEALADRVSGWPKPSAMIAWTSELRNLAAIRGHALDGVAEGTHDTRSPLGAVASTSDPAGDLSLLRVVEQLANEQPEAALATLASLEPTGEAQILTWHLEALARERSGRVDRALLERLASATPRARADADWVSGAVLRLARLDAEAGKDPRSWLGRVPRESTLAPWARHAAAVWMREHGDPAGASAELRLVLSEWPHYPARRQALLELASLSLDDDDAEAARELGLDADRMREAAVSNLERMTGDRTLDSLWSAWADSPTLPSFDPASLGPVREALWRVAIAPRAERARWPMLPGIEVARGSLVPPPSLAELRQACAREAAAWAAHATLEASRRRVEERRREMDRLRAYLDVGLKRTEAELAALDALLVSLRELKARQRRARADLDGFEARALGLLAEQIEALVARAKERSDWARALERIRVPSARESKHYPPGIPHTADLLADEAAYADATVTWLRAYEASAAEAIARNADRLRGRLGPGLDDLLAHATRLKAKAESMRGDLARAIAAAEKDRELARLHEDARTQAALADSLASRSLAFRRSLAKRAVDAEKERLDAERPAIEGLIALATYELCVPGGPRPDLLGEARARIESYLAEHSGPQMRAELRYQLADLLATEERVRFDAAMTEFLARGGPAPLLDLSPSREQYVALLAESPDFPHSDAVLFQLGLLEAEEGDPRCLEHLGAVPPSSTFRQAAILRRADHLFDEGRLAEAMPNYEEAATGTDPALKVVALYKLGWSRFRQDHFNEAADAFRRTLDVLFDPAVAARVSAPDGALAPPAHQPHATESTAAHPVATGEKGQRPVPDLRREAEDYLVHCLTRAGGGPATAEYFDRIGRRDYEARILLEVGQLLRRFSLFADAAEADRIWLERYSDAPGAVDVARGLIESWELGNRTTEARAARLDLAPRFLPGSRWSVAQDSDSSRREGESFSQSALRSVAWDYHRQARQSHAREDWQRALDLYGDLLRHWPSGPQASRDALHAGEAAFQLESYERAVELYGIAADRAPASAPAGAPGETPVRDADETPGTANLASAQQDSIRAAALWQQVAVLDAWYESTRRAGASPLASGETTGWGETAGSGETADSGERADSSNAAGSGAGTASRGAGNPAGTRGPGDPVVAKQFLDRSGSYLDEVEWSQAQGTQTSSLATLSWRRASVALLHGEDAVGAAELGRFLERFPEDERAAQGAALQGDAHTRLAQYRSAGEAYERGLAIAERRGDAELASELRRAVPLSYYRHAEEAETRGEARALVAIKFREIAERWPSFEHSDQCLYRAGLLHRDEKQTEEAIAAWAAIEVRYPDSGYVRDAELESIRLLESVEERARAADRLERFAERHPDDPESAGALLRAAELWQEDGDRAQAERVQLLYLDQHPEDRESELVFLGPMAERALEQAGESRPVSVVLQEEPVVGRYLGAAQARPDLADARIVAQVDFLRAEEARLGFERLPLAAPLDKALAAKRASLDSLIVAYRECMTRAVTPWNHAAGYRVGEALARFGEALEAVEPPPELTAEDAAAYREVLTDEAWTFYDRAEEVWSELLRGTRKAEVPENDWTERARRALWSRLPLRFLHLAAVEYPVVAAEFPEAQ